MKKKISLVFFSLVFIAITVFFLLGLEFPSNGLIQVMFSIIIVITIVFIIRLYLKLQKRQEQILETTDFLQEFAKSKKNNSIAHSDFLEIDKYFNTKNELKDNWKQYKDTIRRIKGNIAGEQKSNYFATIRADYFFDEEFLTKKINIQLYRYIPQLLIALGIFGTFLGLVLGLDGLETGSAAQTQDSIQLLIDGVNLSFLTSLYGIAYSILFTSFQKFFIGNIITEVNSLANQLDLIFPKNTQEDGVKELYNELEKQTGPIESMATDFAEIVDKKINNTLKENLGPTLEKLGESAKRLADVSENTNQDAIEKLVNNTGEIISSATRDEINNLAKTLGAVTAKNEALFNNFNNSIAKVEKMIENQEHVIEQTNNSAANVEKTNQNITSITDELENSLASLNNFSNTQQKTINSYEEIMTEMKDYISQQSKSNQLIASTLEDNYEMAQQQKEINEEFNEASSKLKKASQNLNPLLDNLESNMSGFDNLSEKINSRLVNSISNLEDHYQKINTVIADTVNDLGGTLNELDNNVLDNLEDIAQKYNQISEQLNDFSQQSNLLVNSLQDFSSTQQSAQNLWESYKDSFDNLNQNLEEGVIEYTSNVRSGVNNILGEYDSHIENVLENFNATINQFTDSIEELNDIFYEIERFNKERNE